ncbi:MAG: hydrogenase expression/formation protein HypE [Clostridiales bacterium]|nr:hydrogenase expression/formation protein HypE [Eubacteriales bacterium]MDH7564917.1 hydrogenase expression/formation protein HypE [Clostridiales bacterium]
MTEVITLAHGSGGKMTHDLIDSIFFKYFSNDILMQGNDSALLDLPGGKAAFTTDSFVISPVFFRGGNIGKLAVCGTVNDLASSGAIPMYLSCGFIIEEGLPVGDLEKIVRSMGETAMECGVKIVTGDTKVVQKGAADKVFINTSGIGFIPEGVCLSGAYAKPGDSIIVTGTIGEHGCSILLEREMLEINSEISSDCASLNKMVERVLGVTKDIHVLRDPTRGGLATTLNEIAKQSGVGIRLYDEKVPVREDVRGICELLGLDPMYMANEGKMIIILPQSSVEPVMNVLKREKQGANACVIGEVIAEPAGRVLMKTVTGGNRIVDMLVGDQLPRIC